MSLWAFLLLGPAGAAGALLRWRLDRYVATYTQTPGTGIALVNIVACFLMGLAVAALAGSPNGLAIVATGFLGGLSTFSTAVVDIYTAWCHRRGFALVLAGGVLVISLAACSCGWLLGSQFSYT